MRLNQRMLMVAGSVLTLAAAEAQPVNVPLRTVNPRGPVPTQTIPNESTKVNVNFAGGSLEAFVQALRDATQDPVNISLQGDAAKLHIEPLMLREVTVEAALRAALGSRPGQNMLENDGSMTNTRLEAIEIVGTSNAVLVVTTQRAPGGGPGRGDPSFEVLSIRSLVQSQDAKEQAKQEQTVLKAIDSGLALMGTTDGVRPQIDYHKDSGLLLVRGQARDVGVVSEIVKRMTDDQKRGAIEARERRKNEINSSAAMHRAGLAMNLAETRAAEARKRLDELKQMVEAGTVSTSELSDARMALAQLDNDAQVARVEMLRVQEEAKAGYEAPSPAEPNEEVAQLRSELAKALARIQELESQLKPKKDSNKPAPKG